MKQNFLLLTAFAFLLTGVTACTNYGKKVKIDGTKGEVYYKGGATEDDAKKVGNFLKENGFINNETVSSMQVVKDGDRYIVRFVYNKDYYNKTAGLDNVFKVYAAKMSKELFDGKKVDIALADKYFKDFKKIPYDEAVAKNLDKKD